MRRHRVALGLALPRDARDCESCVERLTRSVNELPQVRDAHVDLSDKNCPMLCIHYEATAVAIETVESLVSDAGARLTSRFKHLTGVVEGIRHERQRVLVERALAAVPGVLHVALGFASRRLLIEFDPELVTRRQLEHISKISAAVGR